MKKKNFIKTVIITLIIIGISIISFFGIYVENKNTMKNLMPDYILGKDLSGYRVVELEVNDEVTKTNYDAEGNVIEETDTQTQVANTVEVKTNEDEVLTAENYEESKKVIGKRLAKMGVKDYTISQDIESGKITIEIPEDDNTDNVVYELIYQGKFEIVDSDTDEVLMTNEDLKTVQAGYGTTNSGYTSVFISFQFNKEGTQKFKDITNTYTETTVETETSEDTENVQEGENVVEETTTEDTQNTETTTVTREITIKLDGQELLTTHFDEEISTGILQLSFGSSSSLTTDELQERLIEANNMAILLDTGKMPIVYDISQNRYMHSDITQEQLDIVIYASLALIIVGIAYLVIRYKMSGIKSAISLIGYIALFLIGIRLFNVEISIAGIFAIILSIVLNYVVIVSILRKNEKENNIKVAVSKTTFKYLLVLAPAYISAIVLTIANISMGAVLFWGIIINLLYNLTVTKILLTDKK